MTRVKAPSKGDRHDKHHGTPVGVALRSGSVAKEPPPLRDGQARCPACRNGATVLDSGLLRAHRDLFETACWNRSPESEPLTFTTPPVVFDEANRTPPNGSCQECQKWVPPMRRLCGACMSRRRT